MKKQNTGVKLVNIVSVKIVIAVGLCLLTKIIIPRFQTVTACVAPLVCIQDDTKQSLKAGLLRLLMVTIGGLFAIGMLLLDTAMQAPALFVIMIMAGVFIILSFCGLTRIPLNSARISCVTFVLVVLTAEGADRISFAFVRLCSTLYGVAAVILVTVFFSLFTKEASPPAQV